MNGPALREFGLGLDDEAFHAAAPAAGGVPACDSSADADSTATGASAWVRYRFGCENGRVVISGSDEAGVPVKPVSL